MARSHDKVETCHSANNLVRYLMGAAATAIIIQIIIRMGRGWCFMFIAAVSFVTSPLLWVLLEREPKWREERRVGVEEHKEEKAAKLLDLRDRKQR